MLKLLVALSSLTAAPSAAQTTVPPPLTMQQATSLKCSAAFALGASMQARGQGAGWPPLAERGREFFVRASAQLMDETRRTREQVADDLRREAAGLGAPGALAAAMPPCLLLLDAAGL
ncbi:hypothetical protein ACWPMX_14110 [Tsuneonella sp. HG094]